MGNACSPFGYVTAPIAGRRECGVPLHGTNWTVLARDQFRSSLHATNWTVPARRQFRPPLHATNWTVLARYQFRVIAPRHQLDSSGGRGVSSAWAQAAGGVSSAWAQAAGGVSCAWGRIAAPAAARSPRRRG